MLLVEPNPFFFCIAANSQRIKEKLRTNGKLHFTKLSRQINRSTRNGDVDFASEQAKELPAYHYIAAP